jgi:hypothetical protein
MLDKKIAIAASVFVVTVAAFAWTYAWGHQSSREPSLLMPPIALSVVKSEYVHLCVGEPCRWLKFKLDRSSHEILIHPGARSAESATFWESANTDRASDYFYFGRLRIRLPVREAPAVLMGFANEWLPDGTLGLGYRSPLWLYWQNFTIGSRRLYLGSYHYWAQEDPDQRPPIFFFDESAHIVMGDGVEAEMVFDFNSPNSLVPWNCDQLTAFQRIEMKGSQCQARYRVLGIDTDDCLDNIVIYPSQFQKIMLASKVEYMAIDYSDDGRVHLGGRLFWEIATHFNLKQRCLIVSPDVYSLDYIGFGMLCSLCLMLALFLWPILATSRNALEDEFQFLLVLLLELFCYFIDAVALAVSFTALNWCRYITQFAERSDTYAMIYIIGVAVLGLGFALVEIKRYRVPYFSACEDAAEHIATATKFRKTFPVRTVLFVSAQIAVLWLLMVEEHEPTLDQSILIYLLSLVIFLQTVIGFSCYLYNKYLQCAVITALSVLTIVFTVLYSLFPLLRYSDIKFNFYAVAAGWLILLVWTPAILCTVLYEIDGHKRRKFSKA